MRGRVPQGVVRNCAEITYAQFLRESVWEGKAMRKTGRKILAVFLALCVAFGTMVWTNRSEEVHAEVFGDFEYKILRDGKVQIEITKYSGSNTDVTVPAMIDGKNVSSIGEKAFINCSDLINVDLPGEITNIGASAFQGCSSLANIDFPDKLTNIGISAFRGCSSLVNIDLPDEITNISDSAFQDCSGLVSANLPDGLKKINYSSFSGCTRLKSVDLPNSLISIGGSAFLDCSNLTSVKLPNGLTSIGGNVFSGCSGLTSINLPSGLTSIGNEAFYNCSNLINIILPNGLTRIEQSTFSGCSSLMNISMPSSLTSIAGTAFSDCSSLTSVNLPEGLTSIDGNGVFQNCTKLSSIYLPSSLTKIGSYCFKNCTRLTSVSLPSDLTSIGNGAFWDCSGLTGIHLPDRITNIENSVFRDCNSLTNISLPSGLESIGNWCFSGCSNLTSITLPSSLTSIGDRAFAECSNLSNISLPDKLKNLGHSVFLLCSSLIDIDLPNGMTNIKDLTFSECSSLKRIRLPDNLKSIGEWVFSDCSNLKSINLPSGVTTIGESAFSDCSSLKSIELPSGVVSIEEFTFRGCSSLTSIRFPDNLTRIGHSAFRICESLITVNFPRDLTSIDDMAFLGCSNLKMISCYSALKSIGEWNFDYTEVSDIYYFGTEEQWNNIQIAQTGNGRLYYPAIKHFNEPVPDPTKDYEYKTLNDNTIEITKYTGSGTTADIPAQIDGKNVTSIGNEAFRNCTALRSVTIPNSVTNIGGYAFGACSSLTDVSIPEGVTNIGEYAFWSCSSLNGINLPDSVTNIGNGAFSRCTALTAIHFPDNMTSLGTIDLFFNCSSLTELTLPDCVTKIDNAAFYNCTKLQEIHIPVSVTSVIEDAFDQCTSLTDVYYSGTEAQWNDIKISDNGNDSLKNAVKHFAGQAPDVSKDYEYKTLTADTVEITKYKGSAQTVTIPASLDGKQVVKIGTQAFRDNTALTEATIPATVTEVDGYAFYNCPNLTALHADPFSESFVSENGILYNKTKTELIRYPEKKSGSTYEIPSGTAAIGAAAFSGCKNLTSVTIPEGMSAIRESAFVGCENITGLILPKSLTQIGTYAFLSCKGLKQISIPDGVKQIESGVFQNCSSLAQAELPQGAAEIGIFAFVGCTSLKSIAIPASVGKISSGAFGNASDPSSLQDIYYGGSEKQWEQIQVTGSDVASGSSVTEKLRLTATIHFQEEQTPPNPIPEEPVLPTTTNAKEELERLKSGDPLSLEPDFRHYLSSEQIDVVESCIYIWLADINYAYQYSGGSGMREQIRKKSGIDPDGNFSTGTQQAVTHISIGTKYGPKTFEITLDLGTPDSGGNLYPSYGTMRYEVFPKGGVPSDVPVNGQIGKSSYTDMGALIQSVAGTNEASLHGTYQWQSLSDELAAGIVIDKTATEIIGNKKGSFCDGFWTVYVQPLVKYSKKVTIACPVDVYVYRMDGQEAGSVIGGKPDSKEENVRLDVNGDTKTVYLTGNDYYLNLRGTDTGTMKYEVEEIANDDVCRNVQFLELQLKKDLQYEGYVFRPLNIDRDLYALRKIDGSEKQVVYADQDIVHPDYQSAFKQVQGLSLSQGSTSMDANRTMQLKASLYPLDASNPDLLWTTDNDSVVSVDKNGLVTAVGTGRATITVSTKDGSFLKQFCMIDVTGGNDGPGNAGNADQNGGNAGGDTNNGTDSGSGSGSDSGNSSGSGGGGSGSSGNGSNNADSGSGGADSSKPSENPQDPVVMTLHYILQFHANGGTNLSRRTMTLLAGDSPGIMPKIQRRNYLFQGWYTRQSGGTRISGDKPLEEAATLYARWTKVKAPAKAAVQSLKSAKKGQVKVCFQKINGVKGYQVQYALNKKFTSAKIKTAGASAKAKTLTGLKAGKKYYVRVRAYTVDSMGNKVYGSYSAPKRVLVKG